MKNTIIQLFAFLLCLPLLHAQEMSKEEAAVLEPIKKAEEALVNRDFDTWSSYWIQEPYAVKYAVDPDNLWDLNGWDEIEKNTRNYMKQSPNPRAFTNLSDIVFLIKSDLATVQFSTPTTQMFYTLEKRGGQWKIAARHNYYKRNFETREKTNQLTKLTEEVEGKWQLDPESVEARSSTMKITGFDLEIIPERTGMKLEGYLDVVFPNGNPGKEWNQIQFHFPNNPETALVNYNWSWTGAPGAVISSGTFEVVDGKKFVGKLTRVDGQNPYVELTIDFKSDDRFRIDWSLLNPQGKEAWGLGCDLVK